MIRHDNKSIGSNTRVMPSHLIPDGVNHSPRIVQHHFPIHNIPEQTFTVMGANGNKIRPRLGIIVMFQSGGTAVMNVGVVGHG
ncbi:MAG: hypothetical protein WBJ37_04425 [Bacteroidales bacterium]